MSYYKKSESYYISREPGDLCRGSMSSVGTSYNPSGHVKISHSQVQCGCCKRILKIWTNGSSYQFIPRHVIPKQKDQDGL